MAKKPEAKETKVADSTISEGETAPDVITDAAQIADAVVTSSDIDTGLPVPDAPQPEGAAETSSTDTPESEAAGGVGGVDANPAGELLKALGPDNLEEAERIVSQAEAEARAAYPHLWAAKEAWEASGRSDMPTGLRVVAKRDGFRRAGMAHSKAGAEHPLETFPTPEQLEALFAEPNLVVTFV